MPRFSHFVSRALGVATVITLCAGFGQTVSADGNTVTRGDFLRAAISTLRIPLEKSGDLPYVRVPTRFQSYARAAYKKGALVPFGSGKVIDFLLPITRGEALEVTKALSQLAPKGSASSGYTDVKTQAEKDAVALALEQKWMRSLRKTFFGVSRPLSYLDERALLLKVKDSMGIIILPPSLDNGSGSASSDIPKQKVMQSVWNLLQQDYLYKDRINAEQAGFASVEGMVDSLKDPYTVFFKPSSAQEFQTQLKGEVTGIGAQVEQKKGVLVIVAPISGSPAEKAGLQPGDEILSVNGESLAGLSYEDAVGKVRGPKGSTANLHISRNGGEMDVSVVRDVVRIDDMDVTYQGSVAVVKLRQFGQLADAEFRSKMQEVATKNPSGIILDLRNDPGGLLDAAGVVTSAFLPAGSIYVEIHTKEDMSQEVTSGQPIFSATLPLIVLVNKGSASASEIVAGALQDAKRAILVGVTTFGKGTVQQLIDFTDGSSLKMTIAEWKTPKGRKIDGLGVEPDVTVTQGQTGDAQMDKAMELLR